MGLMPSLLKARIAAGTAQLYWAVVLSLPSATRQHSDHAIASATGGLFSARVLEWSPFKRSAMDSHGHLEIPETSIVVDDTDRSLAALVASQYGGQIRNSAATLYLADAGLAQSSWLPQMVGRVAAPPDVAGPNKMQLRLVVNDLPLRAKTPALMTRGQWQYAADTGVIGLPAPEIYGRHDSRGQGDGGQVPTLLVDTTLNRYLVQRGVSKSIDQVYDDGLPIYSGYTVEYPIVRGQIYTVFTFSATPTGDVTADVQGLEPNGDGTGALITNPVSALQNWLGRIGVTCDTTLFTTAATWATKHDKHCSMRIADQRLGLDILNDWLDSMGALGFFTTSGTLGIAFDAHDDTSIYPDANALIYEGGGKDDVNPVRVYREYDQILDSVTVRYSFNSVTGNYTQTLPVRDTNLSENADEDYPMPASWAAVVV